MPKEKLVTYKQIPVTGQIDQVLYKSLDLVIKKSAVSQPVDDRFGRFRFIWGDPL